ncbi:hypothetical protein NKH18_47850 [Streptomyces sp. M10(2022)]
MTAFDEVYADVPANERPAVLKRSSCGRSVERGSHIPDYNGHYDLPQTNCRLRCPTAQHDVCAASQSPDEETVRQLLARIDREGTPVDITPPPSSSTPISARSSARSCARTSSTRPHGPPGRRTRRRKALRMTTLPHRAPTCR